MATSSKIQLSPSQRSELYVPVLSEESAQKASELLQKNHENFHIFFNDSGFHNHIVHHLLTLYALGASPSELQAGYNTNASYQRPPLPTKPPIIQSLHDTSIWPRYLGKAKYYPDFLAFFQSEIEAKGWQNVLNEYVFNGDKLADDMLVRMFSGFLHPIIHLGFGVEFEQPVVVAEALAQAAVHDAWIGRFFFGAEEAAKELEDGRRKTIVQLLDEMRGDEKVRKAARFEDANKIRDGLLERAPKEVIGYASQYLVRDDELEEKTAEMIDAAG